MEQLKEENKANSLLQEMNLRFSNWINKAGKSSKNLLYNVQSFFHESGGCLVQSILYFEFGKVKTQQKENHE